jgi:hypothetical protein
MSHLERYGGLPFVWKIVVDFYGRVLGSVRLAPDSGPEREAVRNRSLAAQTASCVRHANPTMFPTGAPTLPRHSAGQPRRASHRPM